MPNGAGRCGTKPSEHFEAWLASSRRDGLRFGRLHRKQANRRIDRAEGLTHADQGAAGADTEHQRIGQPAGWQLREDFRPEDQAVFLYVALRVELAGTKIAGLFADFTRPLECLIDVEITAEKDLGA